MGNSRVSREVHSESDRLVVASETDPRYTTTTTGTTTTTTGTGMGHHHHPNNADDNDPVYRSYHDLAITVIENLDHEPVVVHDLSGPVLTEWAGLERTDSFVTAAARHEPVDLTSVLSDGEGIVRGGTTTTAGATVGQEIASMAKNLMGCGALSLANGIALCADRPQALVAAIFWIVVMGILFGYFCWLIARVCDITKRSTYRGIWQDTVGHRGSLAVSVANALKALMADLAYASILSDTVVSLLAAAHIRVPRLVCLLLVTILGILPLCRLKNLAVLAPFSIIGTAGMLMTTVVMAIRYLDGSYQPGGTYYEHISNTYRPSFGSTDESWSFAILPFVCMVFEAYVMHYNSYVKHLPCLDSFLFLSFFSLLLFLESYPFFHFVFVS